MTGAEQMLELIRTRRSVRAFEPRPVARELLLHAIEAAGWAPSSSNRQDRFFTVVIASEVKREIARAVRERWERIVAENQDSGLMEEVDRYAENFDWFAHVPALIVVSARSVDAFQQHILQDDALLTAGKVASAGMAVQNLMLAAHALGLATCCMTGPVAAQQEIKRIVGLKRRSEIVCLVALGHPAETPAAPQRKRMEDIVRFIE